MLIGFSSAAWARNEDYFVGLSHLGQIKEGIDTAYPGAAISNHSNKETGLVDFTPSGKRIVDAPINIDRYNSSAVTPCFNRTQGLSTNSWHLRAYHEIAISKIVSRKQECTLIPRISSIFGSKFGAVFLPSDEKVLAGYPGEKWPRTGFCTEQGGMSRISYRGRNRDSSDAPGITCGVKWGEIGRVDIDPRPRALLTAHRIQLALDSERPPWRPLSTHSKRR